MKGISKKVVLFFQKISKWLLGLDERKHKKWEYIIGFLEGSHEFTVNGWLVTFMIVFSIMGAVHFVRDEIIIPNKLAAAVQQGFEREDSLYYAFLNEKGTKLFLFRDNLENATDKWLNEDNLTEKQIKALRENRELYGQECIKYNKRIEEENYLIKQRKSSSLKDVALLEPAKKLSHIPDWAW